MDHQYWKITDFAEKISKEMQMKYGDEREGVHYNTVDKWFKALESKGIHYVMRVTDEKVYDESDFQIGCYIYESRKKKWRLDSIYENLNNVFELRPSEKLMDNNDESLMNNVSIKEEVEILMQQHLEGQKKEMERYKEELFKAVKEVAAAEMRSYQALLPEPDDKKKAMNDYLTISLKVSMNLEREAIIEWEKKPFEERMKRVGWFKKEEDLYKRESFVREYKMLHKREAIEKAMTEE
ncbi:hypothetical protein [Bacillus sp. FJAT-45037]|uniref:hypothetical protein n=1 Tax=Bacillus sp. FJAT-45037 TaxID=2011007 RepID=UPI000C24A588|nr:hypothetical protein [Bacillus sp. FJAT-45037]